MEEDKLKIIDVKRLYKGNSSGSVVLSIPKRFYEKNLWGQKDYVEVYETPEGNLLVKKQED